MNELREIVSERLGRCRCALNHTPLVAALVKGETPSWDWSEFGFPKVMTLVTEARLRYRGEECRLWVLEPRQWPLAETETPAKVLLAMQTALEEVLGSHGFLLREECNVWPIQAGAVHSDTLMALVCLSECVDLAGDQISSARLSI